MKIGLYNLEPQIVNTAMMQVSTYHKQKGNPVEAYNHLLHNNYDKIYAFSIFDFTPKHYVTPDMITGGTGFDITSRLPQEIEDCNYDYSIFPECDYSIVWFSRGCIRKCPFCVVPHKEGGIHSVKPKALNQNGKHIVVRDNNFFANPSWRDAVEQLREWGQPIDIEQGVDVRLFDEEQYDALNSLNHFKQIHIAWDDPHYNMIPKLEEMIQHIKPHKIMCYVLIGFNSTIEEDLYRVETLRDLKIDPYVMPFNPKDAHQKRFKRWVNRKNIFESGVSWGEYKQKKRIEIGEKREQLKIDS